MCSPVLAIVGGIVQGIGAAQSMQAQAQNSEMQAEAQEQRAEQEYMSGAYRATRSKDQTARTGGQQRAAAAEGGLSGGSVSDVSEDTAQEAQLDIDAIMWNSNAAVSQQKFAARVSRQNASNARAAAPLAFLSPVLGTATQLYQSGYFGGGTA